MGHALKSRGRELFMREGFTGDPHRCWRGTSTRAPWWSLACTLSSQGHPSLGRNLPASPSPRSSTKMWMWCMGQHSLGQACAKALGIISGISFSPSCWNFILWTNFALPPPQDTFSQSCLRPLGYTSGGKQGQWPFYDEVPWGPQGAAGAAQHDGGKTRGQRELPSLSRPALLKEARDNIKWAGSGKKGRDGASRRPAQGEGGGCLAAHHAAADRQGGRLAGSL